MSTIAASPPFQFLSRRQTTTVRGAPDRRLIPAARHAIAWTWNTKIISNVPFRFLSFPAHVHARPGTVSTKRNGARCIMLRGSQIWRVRTGWPVASSKSVQRKGRQGTQRKNKRRMENTSNSQLPVAAPYRVPSAEC
jgi:hypothetical protein